MLTFDIFVTPLKAFYLLSYAGGLVHMFANVPSPVPTCPSHYNRQVLDFVNIEAK